MSRDTSPQARTNPGELAEEMYTSDLAVEVERSGLDLSIQQEQDDENRAPTPEKERTSFTLNPDLIATVGTLFGIEHDLQEEYDDLGKRERKLLYDIGDLLEKLSKWMSLDNPGTPPYDGLVRMRRIILRDGVDELCQHYLPEIECWAEEHQETIRNVEFRATAWKFSVVPDEDTRSGGQTNKDAQIEVLSEDEETLSPNQVPLPLNDSWRRKLYAHYVKIYQQLDRFICQIDLQLEQDIELTRKEMLIWYQWLRQHDDPIITEHERHLSLLARAMAQDAQTVQRTLTQFLATSHFSFNEAERFVCRCSFETTSVRVAYYHGYLAH